MIKVKRVLGVALAVLLLASMIGCAQMPEPSAAELPTVRQTAEERAKITIGIPASDAVDDFENNAFTRWLEQQTGYDIQVVAFQRGGDVKPGFVYPVPESAEGLPDILLHQHINSDQLLQYAGNGVIVDLKAYYQDSAGASRTFWSRLEELGESDRAYVKDLITADDGGMYAFPTVEYAPNDNFSFRVFINRNWLDALKLEMPTDPESLRLVLEAFRDGDPNGNGKKDDLPMVGSVGVSSGDLINWIVNMFVPCSREVVFQLDEQGTVFLPHVTDEYREALCYIRDLVEDGLLYPSVFSMSSQELHMLLEEQTPVVGVWAGDPEALLAEGNAAIYDYEAMPYWGSVSRTATNISATTYISGNCKNVDAAWEVLMQLCSWEGSFHMRYGERGTDWELDDGVSYTGGKTLRLLTDGKTDAAWGGIYATIFVEQETRLQYDAQRDDWNEKMTDLLTSSYFHLIDARAPREEKPQVVPLYCVGPESGEAMACRNLIRETVESFCCGVGTYNDPGDDGQWNAYLAELDALGLPSWQQEGARALE